MRSDSNLKDRFTAEGVDTREYGSMPGVLDTNTRVEGRGRVLRSHSFSGHETNSLFVNAAGRSFADLSALSGVDSISDGRGFAYLDFDRDGWTDIALVNSNAPQLELFRNRLGDLGGSGKSMQVQVVGGQGRAPGMSPRDGAGAHVLAKVGPRTLRREFRLGDGFAAQNSASLSVGLGEQAAAEEVRVVWPSGKVTEVGRVAAGTRVTVREAPADGEPAVQAVAAGPPSALPPAGPPVAVDEWTGSLPPTTAKLRMVTTMATWCAVCRGELPHVADLRAALPAAAVEMLGFPIDPEDSEEKLAEYQRSASPAYTILGATTSTEKEAMKALLTKHLGEAALPSTLLVDARGRVVRVRKGLPTLSEVRRWLRQIP